VKLELETIIIRKRRWVISNSVVTAKFTETDMGRSATSADQRRDLEGS
jgi:hypothetical protein